MALLRHAFLFERVFFLLSPLLITLAAIFFLLLRFSLARSEYNIHLL